LPWARRFVARFAHYVDDFVAFPGAPELPEQTADVACLPLFFADAVDRRFDLAVQMHGDGVHTNAIVAKLGARRIAGFRRVGAESPCAGMFAPYPAHLHEIRRNTRLVEILGARPAGEALEFPITRDDCDEPASLPGAARFSPNGYVYPQPLSPDEGAERFARIADALFERGYDVVLTGSNAEWPITEAVSRAMRRPSENLAAPVLIGALAAFLANARLLVTNDTGESRLAVGVGVPSVVIFFATDPTRRAPLDAACTAPFTTRAAGDCEAVLRAATRLRRKPAIAGAPDPLRRLEVSVSPGATES
jgi:ADP-heptose:LPS heptosyltransferase